MKNITLIVTFLLLGVFVSAQDVMISDFDGTSLEGLEIGVWSYSLSADTLDNPVTDGINASANSIFFPAHYFESYWGWQGGFLCFDTKDPSIFSDYKYLQFKYLIINDDHVEGDGVKIDFKWEAGSTGDVTESGLFEVDIDAGGPNVWAQANIEIPAAVIEGDNPKVCFINMNVGETAVDMYFDDIGVGDTEVENEPSSIQKLKSENGISVYMNANLLNIRMEETTLVKTVQVYDIKGSMIINKEYNSMEKNFSLPVNMGSGIYILKVTSDQETIARKFVR